MAVYLVISQPKTPYIHRIYVVLANPVPRTCSCQTIYKAKSKKLQVSMTHVIECTLLSRRWLVATTQHNKKKAYKQRNSTERNAVSR